MPHHPGLHGKTSRPLPVDLEREAPVIGRSRAYLTAFHNDFANIFRRIEPKEQIDLPVAAEFHEPLDDEKTIPLEIDALRIHIPTVRFHYGHGLRFDFLTCHDHIVPRESEKWKRKTGKTGSRREIFL